MIQIEEMLDNEKKANMKAEDANKKAEQLETHKVKLCLTFIVKV
jgi:hypothetical protein